MHCWLDFCMPSLSGDRQSGLQRVETPVIVLRLETCRYGASLNDPDMDDASWLEIGFGTIPQSGQGTKKALLHSDPTLRLTVFFPQSGDTGTYLVKPKGVATEEPLRVLESPAPEEPSCMSPPCQTKAFRLDVLRPYDFSGIAYDPPGSMAASLGRLVAETSGRQGDGVDGLAGGLARLNDGLMALWSAVETDLHRFAKDPGFTAAVDGAEKEQPGEYRRFARLNELYRDIIKLLVPYGLPPRRWTAWLRGQEYRPFLTWGLSLALEGFLAGQTRLPREALASLSKLLARHGPPITMERD